jgi:hypothetical protein
LHRRRIRTRHRRRRAAPVAVALAAAGLAGCGGDRPHLARTDAAPLIALSKRIAREGKCGQARDIRKLQAQTISLVNARRVSPSLQETLLSGVNQLVAQAPVCVPQVAPAAVEPLPPAAATPRAGHERRKHHPKKHGHGEGD